MISTRIGLPNTCATCGGDPGATWYAPNEDVARSGGGQCATCAGVNNERILQPHGSTSEAEAQEAHRPDPAPTHRPTLKAQGRGKRAIQK